MSIKQPGGSGFRLAEGVGVGMEVLWFDMAIWDRVDTGWKDCAIGKGVFARTLNNLYSTLNSWELLFGRLKHTRLERQTSEWRIIFGY